jgi:3'-5' exoribonuclease
MDKTKNLTEPLVREYIDQIHDMLTPLTDARRADLNRRVFSECWRWPGSIDKHHAYEGGLVKHTYEVMCIAYDMAETTGAVKTIVMEAAAWHDVGKVRCYAPLSDGTWIKTGVYHQVGHVIESHHMYLELEGNNLAVEHAILAHHGRREWRSPVEPQTLEAWVVHWADMSSAKPWDQSTAVRVPAHNNYLQSQ